MNEKSRHLGEIDSIEGATKTKFFAHIVNSFDSIVQYNNRYN